MVKADEMGEFLEAVAAKAAPITYSDVLRRFPKLPPLTGSWRAHPLCCLFGELDGEDEHASRPLRTAIFVTKETGLPGQGFFDTVDKVYGTKTEKADRANVWLSEYIRLVAYYSGRSGQH